MAEALAEAASWVNCEEVRVERTTPDGLRQPLVDAIGRA
jgi:hypothetical protein